MEQRLSKIEAESRKASTNILQTKEDIAQQEVRARELSDNVQLLTTVQEIKTLDEKIRELRRQLSQYGDYQEMSRQKTDIQTQLDELRKNKAACEGRLKGYDDEVKR